MANTPSTDTPAKPEYLILGEILRPHGVAGEVKMRVLTAYPERLADLDTVYLGHDPEMPEAKAYTVQGARMHQGYALMKLAGINDRNQADALRENYVMIRLEDAIPLEEGEFYLYQLIGLDVETQDGQPLGKLVEVLETGANDVYIVDSPQYGELLIPVIESVVLKTDISAGKVIVKLPEGLLPSA